MILRELSNCAKLSPGVLRSWSSGPEFLIGAQRERTMIEVVHRCLRVWVVKYLVNCSAKTVARRINLWYLQLWATS
jgi:hypothetical protein